MIFSHYMGRQKKRLERDFSHVDLYLGREVMDHMDKRGRKAQVRKQICGIITIIKNMQGIEEVKLERDPEKRPEPDA